MRCSKRYKKQILTCFVSTYMAFGLALSAAASETNIMPETEVLSFENEIEREEKAEMSEYKKIVHLDAGRKFFSVDEIKGMIDTAAESGYNYFELAVGNNGLRFLLDDMTVEANGVTYSSEEVTAGIQRGNKVYYNAGKKNELTQEEMDTILAYAAEKEISIIPLLNSPGHMDAIVTCMKDLGIKHAAFAASEYGTSHRTVDVTNEEAVAFTQALIQKYMVYFAEQGGCTMFNFGADEYANDKLANADGMGFGYLLQKEQYGFFVEYVNTLSAMVKELGMIPIAFNDGIYYNCSTENRSFDKDIVIAYWTCGWNGYSPASAAFLADKGHEIISTNDAWYYIIGRTEGIYKEASARKGVAEAAYDSIPGGKEDMPKPIGSMLCIWCDEPEASYEDNEAVVKELITEFAKNNREIFKEER